MMGWFQFVLVFLFGFFAAGAVFFWLQQRNLLPKLVGVKPSVAGTTTIQVNDNAGHIAPGDNLLVDDGLGRRETRRVLARDGSTLTLGPLGRIDTVLGHRELADVLLRLQSSGMLHVRREGEYIVDGLSVQALNPKHPATCIVHLKAGQQRARLWLFPNGQVQLDLVTTNTVNPGLPLHDGYLASSSGPNPFGIKGYDFQEVGKGQEDTYNVLHALIGPEPERAVFSRWTFTDEQRAAIRDGKDIWLEQWTFGHKFQPVRLSVGVPEELQGDGVPAFVAGPDPRD